MRLVLRCLIIFVLIYLATILLLALLHGTHPEPTSLLDTSSGSFFSSLFVSRPQPLARDDPNSDSLAIIGSDTERLPYRQPSFSTNDPNGDPEGKLILMWAGPSDVDQKNLNGCPDLGCTITHDHRLANRSAAIVFIHGASDAPPVRRPWQYYVFFTQESPNYVHVLQPYKYFFNLTLSYRRDSDAPSPYGYAIARPKPSDQWKKGLKSLIPGKEKLVAWFVSNCDASSNRDLYVKELQKWIPVDVYGSCGNLTCSRRYVPPRPSNQTRPWSYDMDEDEDFDRDKDDCDRMLERDYKFYLAFENSLCKDYTTEKFWQKLTLRIVPVVLKRSIVQSYAPPGSFIAADDFRSPRELAMYLKELASDPVAYERRFDWRRDYRIVFLNGNDHDVRERPWGFCTLCSIIHGHRPAQRTYADLNEWWSKDAKCDALLVKRLLAAVVI